MATGMTSSTVSGIIWTYMSYSTNTLTPYPPDISNELELHYQNRKPSHSIMLNGVTYTFDFRRLTVTDKLSAGTTRIARSPVRLPASPPLMGYWEWDSGVGCFLPYSMDAIVIIETHYCTNPTIPLNLQTTSANIPYSIDFSNMTQTRHGYGTARTIRRVPLSQPLQELLSSSAVPAAPTVTHSFSSPASSMLATKRVPVKTSKSLKTASSSKSRTSKATSSATGTSYTSGGSKAAATSRNATRTKARTTNSTHSIPNPSDNSLVLLKDFIESVTSLASKEDDGPCPICMNDLSEASGFEEDAGLPPADVSPAAIDLFKLKKCGHMMHRACLIMYSKNSKDGQGCIRCPTCKEVHGVQRGDMPTTGRMTVTREHRSLPGHEGYGMIIINYSFHSGTQNGVRYSTNGFPRTCYLPDSPRGNKVLKLLRIAWDRRLTFTIGTSVTTGTPNTIVWNEIHHKTEAFSNYSGHGYPDPNYLDNVLAELAAQGVTDEDDTQ